MVDPDRIITFDLDKNQKLLSFIDAVHKQHPPAVPNVLTQPVLALDPGETTGVAEYDGSRIIQVYQKTTKDIGQSYDWLHGRLVGYQIGYPPFKHLRYEDYRVYEWKSEDHAWSPVHTLRWIGAIQVACHITNTPNSCLMAANPKKFWTDDKLNLFGLNPKGLRHGRDALRHLLYYLLFPTK